LANVGAAATTDDAIACASEDQEDGGAKILKSIHGPGGVGI
jgi:hypothetical protein